jgi:hypothetical protein
MPAKIDIVVLRSLESEKNWPMQSMYKVLRISVKPVWSAH